MTLNSGGELAIRRKGEIYRGTYKFVLYRILQSEERLDTPPDAAYEYNILEKSLIIK